MKRSLIPVAVGTAGLIGASVLTFAPASKAGETQIVRADGGVDWVSCEKFGFGGAGTDCGYVTVPLDWAKPTGTKIKLAISRVKATVTGGKYQGVMLVNPGGPGGSGLQFSGLQGLLPNNSGNSYDWIGFDPRGVGASQPSMNCIRSFSSDQHPSYFPKKTKKITKSEKAWLKLSKSYATACGEKNGALLAHMHTTDWVRDMDAIRSALGANQINYLGFSYGTYLGQVYSTMYPTHVRRMLLDGNVDPRGVWYQAQLSQDRAFEKVANQFFAWTAKNNATYKLGSSAGEVRKKYLSAVQGLKAKRVDGVGANEWTDTFVQAMYAESLWPDAAQAFASWVLNQDMGPAQVAYKQSLESDDNLFAVYNAVQCSDAAWPKDYKKTWRKDAFATAKNAPLLTWSNVWFNTACIYWPVKASKPVTVGGSVPMLLLNATLDGATPYSGAIEVRKRFPQARLVAEVGATTHAGSTLAGNNCIDKVVADYLKTGKLPARKAGNDADVSCQRTAQPEPGLLPIDTQGTGLPQVASVPESGPSVPAPDPNPHGEQSMFDKIVGLLPSRR